MTLNEEIRQIQEEIQSLCEKIGQIQEEIQGMKFADSTSEGNKSEGGQINTRKWRTSLPGGTVDRKDDGKMVMTFSLSTNVMSKNVHRDKEQEKNFKKIRSAMERLEITVSSGCLASEKLKPTDRTAIATQPRLGTQS